MAYAMRLGASLEQAEDLVQDTLLVTIDRPEWFDAHRASLGTALITVLRNRYLDGRRHLGVQRRAAPQLRLVTSSSERMDGMDRLEARAARQRLLGALDPRERAVFRAWLLQREGHFDGQGAARSVDLSYAAYEAAKKRLRRKVRSLMAELELETADLFDPEGEG